MHRRGTGNAGMQLSRRVVKRSAQALLENGHDMVTF